MKTSLHLRLAAASVAALLLLAPQAPAAPGDPDTFDPNADNRVSTSAVQPDGKVIIGGQFLNISGTAKTRIARLEANGTLDAGFTASASGTVRSIAVQPDGKIIIGGSFDTVNLTTRNLIARLNADGTLDTAFDPNLGTSGGVECIALLPDGKILVGGTFLSAGGVALNYLARLDANGTLDATFDAGVGIGQINSIAVQEDGMIVVAGNFSSIGGGTRNDIARLDGTGAIDATFDPGTGADNPIETVVVQTDGNILIGGQFTTFNGTARSRFARLSSTGALEAGFDPDANSAVKSIALQADGKMVFGGFFWTLDTTGTPVTRNRVARLEADGSLDSLDPNVNLAVDGVTAQADGKIIITGAFGMIGDQARNRIGRVENDAATGALTVPSSSRIQWLRGGTAPEAAWVMFESSTDGGANWTFLGAGTRITGGWELTALSIPAGAMVRASAIVPTGWNNGSSSLLEATATAPAKAPTLQVRGKRTLRTTRPRVILRGTAGDPDGDLAAVRYRDSRPKGRRLRPARGLANWSAVVVLKKGRNVVTVQAFDAIGLKSPIRRVTIRRTSKSKRR